MSTKNNVLDIIRSHRPKSVNLGSMEVHADYDSNDAAQRAYFQVITIDQIEAVCVDGKLAVYWDEE
jgi:hypothetical protein